MDNKLISLFEKIERQDSNLITKANLIKPELIIIKESANIDRFPYVPFIKKALEINYNRAANILRLDNHSINTGLNFIESVIEYKKAKCPDELNRFSYNYNSDLKDTALESTFNCIIESYGKKIKKATSDISKITGYNEEYLSNTNKQVIDEFEKEIEHNTPEKLIEKIADRVEKATQKFIEKRNDDTERVKMIYNAVQKIKNDPAQDDNMKDMAQEAMKQNLSNIRNKPISLFESMIVNLSESVMKDEGLRKIYCTENNDLNIGKIVDDVSALYIVMEECNIFGLLKMDQTFLQDFMNGFKN